MRHDVVAVRVALGNKTANGVIIVFSGKAHGGGRPEKRSMAAAKKETAVFRMCTPYRIHLNGACHLTIVRMVICEPEALDDPRPTR